LDYADLERRIDALCAQAASRNHEPALMAEIEWLLGEGYLRALQGDRLAREQGHGGEATVRLRSRLAVMQEHWLALQAGASA
jgi:hypothetical protein